MSILLQKKNVGDYSYMSSPNIYYRAYICIFAYKPIHTKLVVTELHIGNMINSIGVILVAYIVCYFCKSVKKILILRNAS